MLRALVLALALLLAGTAQAESPDGDAVGGGTWDTTAVPVSKSTGKNCLGDPRPKLILSNLFGIKYGDWGLENQTRIGLCTPLIKKPGILFDLSFVEAGFVMHFTPIYLMPGAYLTLAPLSVLQFQVEAAPILYWPIGVSAAGYYPIPSITSDYSKASLPAEEGGTAQGGYVRFGPNIQLAAPLGPLRLIILDQMRFEFFSIGDADYYFHNRNDLPAARDQWFFENMAIVLVEIPLSRTASLMVGANDQLTRTIGAKAVSNAVRGTAMLRIDKPWLAGREFTTILAVGGRTHHPVRQGDFNFILAFSFRIDLTHKKQAAPDWAKTGKKKRAARDLLTPVQALAASSGR